MRLVVRLQPGTQLRTDDQVMQGTPVPPSHLPRDQTWPPSHQQTGPALHQQLSQKNSHSGRRTESKPHGVCGPCLLQSPWALQGSTARPPSAAHMGACCIPFQQLQKGAEPIRPAGAHGEQAVRLNSWSCLQQIGRPASYYEASPSAVPLPMDSSQNNVVAIMERGQVRQLPQR